MLTNWYNDFIVCQYTCTGAENLHLNYKKPYKIIFPFFFSKGKQKLLVSFERQDMKNPIVCCNFATRIKPKRQGLKIRDNFESS